MGITRGVVRRLPSLLRRYAVSRGILHARGIALRVHLYDIRFVARSGARWMF
jgi:hypothetical protein